MSDLIASRDAPVIAEGLFSFKIGGSERVGADMAIEFAARGYRVICFALYGTDGPIRDELETRGIRCVDLDYTTRNRYLRPIAFQLEFFRFLKRENVNCLHVHHATALVLCGRAAKYAGLNHVVMTEHALHQLRERPRYRAQATHYCRYADSITAVHAGIAEYFHDEMHVPSDRLHVITNGVRILNRNVATRERIRNQFGFDADEFCFLFAGRLEAVKDVSTLLRSYALLPADQRERARLLIAGDGSERSMLENLARALGILGSVVFLGARTDVPDLLCVADAFIMTSVTEGLPMALIEAMAAQVPCIATAVGGIPDLLADGVGALVPPGNSDAIAATMTELMRNSAERADMASRGRHKAQTQYDIDRVVTKYLQLLGLPSHWENSAA